MRYAFGPFVLDPRAARLRRDGATVVLGPDAVELLVRLVHEPGKVLRGRSGAAHELAQALGAGWVAEVDEDGARFPGPVRSLAPAPPERMGEFEVLGLLGEGGMAQVWLVRHPVLHRQFALKRVRGSTAQLNERILREARAQSSVRHPHVLEVLDVFELDGRPALLLPLVEGPSLRAVLARIPPDADRSEVLRTWFPVFRQAIEGVAAIHAAGLVHRDLKPSNLLLDLSGPRVVPMVADFGVAKALADHRLQQHLTGAGAAIGTPAYAAPEQLEDAVAVDARADVWALGCILHHLATGAPPKRVDGKPILADLDPIWSTALRRMVCVDPNDRLPDAAAVLQALPSAPPGAEDPDLDDLRAMEFARTLPPVPDRPAPAPPAPPPTPPAPAPAPVVPTPTPGRSWRVVAVVAVVLAIAVLLAALW